MGRVPGLAGVVERRGGFASRSASWMSSSGTVGPWMRSDAWRWTSRRASRPEGGAPDLDRGPAGRPEVDLRAAGPRPLPQQRGGARAGPVRRPRDRPLAGPKLPDRSIRPSGPRRSRCSSPGPRSRRRSWTRSPSGKIRREDITAFHARQILSLGDPAAGPSARRGLGRAARDGRRSPGSDRGAQEEPGSPRRSPRPIAAGGGALFDRLCASCHRLHGRGGEIGPDLTGSGRDNLDYLLENIVDPGAAVECRFPHGRRGDERRPHPQRPRQGADSTDADPPDADGSPHPRPLRDRGVRPSTSSLMPDGLLDPLKPDEIRDLIAYLSHPTQVPLPSEVSPSSGGTIMSVTCGRWRPSSG